MLARVLEPEAMDTPEEADAYDRMDHADVNARFVADFLELRGPCRGGTIVDVGTGPGRIAIALCRADSGAIVLGVDLAEAMIQRALINVRDEGLGERIRLRSGDARTLDLPSNGFEGVISNSIIHHIPDPSPVLAEMIRLVRPGGTLMVRDLVRPDDAARLNQLVATYAGNESTSARDLFAASLRAAFTLDEVRAMVADLGVPAEGVILTSDRHWTWSWKNWERAGAR